MKQIILRRYSVRDMFDIVEKSNLFSRGSNSKKGVCKFIAIPRYNAVIRLNYSSIYFFFNYIYKVRTIKTYFIWTILMFISVLSYFSFILKLLKIQFQIYSPQILSNTEWKKINVLFAEWHFIGVYTKGNNTVTHLLSNTEYINRLENEINARRICQKHNIDVIPQLFSTEISKNGYWIEEISVDKNKQFISDEDFNISMQKLCNIYNKTVKYIEFNRYFESLKTKLLNVKSKEIQLYRDRIYSFIETNSNKQNFSIKLALAHGDFNKGQILKKNNKLIFIDWSDGGMFNLFFDIISVTLNLGGENTFRIDLIPKEYSVLKKYFLKEISLTYFDLFVALTLLETLSVQHNEFDKRRGPYKRWTKQVELFLKQHQTNV